MNPNYILTSSSISACLLCNILATASARNLPTRYLLTAHSNSNKAIASSVADACKMKKIDKGLIRRDHG